MPVSARPYRYRNACQQNDVLKDLASKPIASAMRWCSERIGGVPEALVLRDPCVRFGLAGKARGELRQSTDPRHLDGEAVIVSLDHVVSRIGHGLSPVEFVMWVCEPLNALSAWTPGLRS
jgi:hypothetical protein